MNAAFFSIFQYVLVYWTLQGFQMAGAETLYATIGSDLIIKCPNDEVKFWQYSESKEVIADCESDKPNINPKLNISDRFDVTSDCQLKIQNLTTSDLCIYFCMAYTNDSEDYKISVKLRNLKIHGVNSFGFIHGTEGENLTLTCTVIGFLPGDTLHWTSNKKSLASGSSQSLSYTLQANRSYNMNKFTCMVNNSKETHSLKTRVQLNLLLKPAVSITVSINSNIGQKEKSVTVRQDQSINLHCRENYNASDDVEIFSWLFNGNVLRNNTSTIVLNKTNRESSGQYTCIVRNKAGNDSDTVNITVTYPPTVRNKTITFNESNRPRIIECEVSGEPNPHNYSWSHYTNNNQLVRNFKSSSDRNLKLPEGNENGLSYEDSGVYVCNVTNGITDKSGQLWQTGKIKVIVEGKPVLAKPQRSMYFGNFNGTSIISLFVLSSSNVLKAEWKGRNGRTRGFYPCRSTVNKTLFYGKVLAVSGYQCAYKILNTKEQDFQNYTVDLRNKNGIESVEISLVSSRAPEVPDITGVYQRQNNIVLEWKPNFDGGAPQSFIVQYRKNVDDIWTSVSIKTNETKDWFYISNPQPNTKYVLRMLASNRLGNSSFTVPYIVHTDDEKKNVWIQFKFWFLSIAVVLPVCLVVILWRYRQARKTVPNNSSRRNSYPDQGVVIGNDINESANRNDVYSSIDSRQQILDKLQVNYKVAGMSKGGNKSDNENMNQRSSRKRMNDSSKLNYIEIAFDPVTLKREFRIHGADNRTPYADIDFTAKADPMISSDESDTGSFLNENNENDFVSLEDVQQWNIHSE